MSTSSDTELRTLPADQQQAIAKIELHEFRRRERLIAKAQSYSGKRWVTPVFLLLGLCVGARNVESPYVVLFFALILLNFTLLHAHVHGLNQRLDALLMLRDAESDAGIKGSVRK